MIMKLLAILLLASLDLLLQTEAVEYLVLNKAVGTKGSTRFEKEIGAKYTVETLAKASNFTWEVLRQGKMNERKPYDHVRLHIEDWDGISETKNNDISVSASFIGNYSGDVKKEFTVLLYHAVAHVWQWSGQDQAPDELVEGIADYVALKAQEAAYPQHWTVAKGGGGHGGGGGGHGGGGGGGNRGGSGGSQARGKRGSPWKSNARFMEHLNQKKDGFVAELNQKLRRGYSEAVFKDLLGKFVEELWDEFQDSGC